MDTTTKEDTMTEARAAAIEMLAEATDDRAYAEEMCASDDFVRSLVFHDIEPMDMMFKVRIFVEARKVATIYRRTESDAHASAIRVSAKYAKLAS